MLPLQLNSQTSYLSCRLRGCVSKPATGNLTAIVLQCCPSAMIETNLSLYVGKQSVVHKRLNRADLSSIAAGSACLRCQEVAISTSIRTAFSGCWPRLPSATATWLAYRRRCSGAFEVQSVRPATEWLQRTATGHDRWPLHDALCMSSAACSLQLAAAAHVCNIAAPLGSNSAAADTHNVISKCNYCTGLSRCLLAA